MTTNNSLNNEFPRGFLIPTSTYSKGYPVKKLFYDYLGSLAVPFFDPCCPEASSGDYVPVRSNADGTILQYYNSTTNTWVNRPGAGGSFSISEGDNITIDDSDPSNLIISSTVEYTPPTYDPTSVLFADGAGAPADAVSGLFWTGVDLGVGYNDPNSLSGIALNGSRGTIRADFNGIRYTAGGGGTGNYDINKHHRFYNNNMPVAYLDIWSENLTDHRSKFTTKVFIDLLATGLTAPTTSGTTKMVTTDANGLLSFANIPDGLTIPGGLSDFADDAAAAIGSIPVNGLYRTGSIVKIRVV